MKHCGVCGEDKPLEAFNRNHSKRDGRQCKCKECTRKYYRRYYARNREEICENERARKAANQPQILAQRAVWLAMKSGKLKRQPCEVCGGERRIEAHHDDYAKPLEVRWLCKEHHQLHHAALYHAEKAD